MSNKKQTTKKEVVEQQNPQAGNPKKYEMSAEDVGKLDMFFSNAIYSDRNGVLDYKAAFYKTIEIVKQGLKEV